MLYAVYRYAKKRRNACKYIIWLARVSRTARTRARVPKIAPVRTGRTPRTRGPRARVVRTDLECGLTTTILGAIWRNTFFGYQLTFDFVNRQSSRLTSFKE